MTDSIRDILVEAFNRVQNEHGLALTSVHFDLIDTSRVERDCYAVHSIRVTGETAGRKETRDE